MVNNSHDKTLNQEAIIQTGKSLFDPDINDVCITFLLFNYVFLSIKIFKKG
jgi:hypothetical protein